MPGTCCQVLWQTAPASVCCSNVRSAHVSFSCSCKAMPSTLPHSLSHVAAAADEALRAGHAISRVQCHGCLHAWLTLRPAASSFVPFSLPGGCMCLSHLPLLALTIQHLARLICSMAKQRAPKTCMLEALPTPAANSSSGASITWLTSRPTVSVVLSVSSSCKDSCKANCMVWPGRGQTPCKTWLLVSRAKSVWESATQLHSWFLPCAWPHHGDPV